MLKFDAMTDEQAIGLARVMCGKDHYADWAPPAAVREYVRARYQTPEAEQIPSEIERLRALAALAIEPVTTH